MEKKRNTRLLCSLLLLSILLFTSCSSKPNKNFGKDMLSPYNEKTTLENVWIEVKEDTVTPTGLEIVFHNTSTRDDLYFGSWLALEKQHDKQWFKIDYLEGNDNFAWLDWARKIYTDEYLEQARIKGETWTELAFEFLPNEMTYNWEPLYGKLAKGEYRIVVEVTSRPDYARYYLTAEFIIR